MTKLQAHESWDQRAEYLINHIFTLRAMSPQFIDNRKLELKGFCPVEQLLGDWSAGDTLPWTEKINLCHIVFWVTVCLTEHWVQVYQFT